MNMRADATAIEEMSPEQALAMIERMQREADRKSVV